MIVDCHTQIWDSATARGRADTAMVSEAVQADAMHHLEALVPVDHAFVLAFKSSYLEAEIPNRFVADYVRQNASKMVGFAGIDPTEVDWREELRIAQEELHLKGVTVSPALQNFHPCDTRAMRLYEQCASRKMPIIFEQNHRSAAAKMEFSRPALLDEVAREFPDLPIVIAHMGHPWIAETVVLLGKHERVFANVAGLLRQTWTAYNALLTAYECDVMNKLLFGSGFPHRSPTACIESLYSINQIREGTSLAAIPREQLRGIVERDALALLGIEQPAARVTNKPKSTILADDE
ncbi:MAG: amidohydrolase family protein [Planctomycetes bacterium]|nr:amidohydrolase family protein [Planctomycetota bacterium]